MPDGTTKPKTSLFISNSKCLNTYFVWQITNIFPLNITNLNGCVWKGRILYTIGLVLDTIGSDLVPIQAQAISCAGVHWWDIAPGGHCWDHCLVPCHVVHPWWRHQMETFSALLALCAGKSPVTGEFPAQIPVTRCFFYLRLNKSWVNNREAGDLRRHRAHYDVTVMWERAPVGDGWLRSVTDLVYQFFKPITILENFDFRKDWPAVAIVIPKGAFRMVAIVGALSWHPLAHVGTLRLALVSSARRGNLCALDLGVSCGDLEWVMGCRCRC